MIWLTSKRFGIAALGIALAMEVVCAILVVVSANENTTNEIITSAIAIPTFALLAGVGAVILSRQPWHAVGLMFALSPLAMMVANIASFYYTASLKVDLPGRVLAALAGNPAWLLGAGSAAIFLPLLFPTGHYLTHRWRWAGLAGGLGLTMAIVTTLLRPGYIDDFEDVANPIGIEGATGVLDVIALVGFVLIGLSVISGLLSLVLRFRRARGVEREQLKWVLATSGWAVTFFGVITPIANNVFGYYPPDVVFLTTIALIPASVAVAMLRYHLYDIDRIINRTLVYGLLSAGLGALYAGLVVGLQEVLQSVSGGSDLAIVVTTLVVAALFLPARRRVQVTVDRRFNRRQYDAVRTVEAFSARLRQHIELDALRYELLAVIDETMAPTSKSVWLRRQS